MIYVCVCVYACMFCFCGWEKGKTIPDRFYLLTIFFTVHINVLILVYNYYSPGIVPQSNLSSTIIVSRYYNDLGARCSSVVRAFAHGAMGHRIDPSWSTH